MPNNLKIKAELVAHTKMTGAAHSDRGSGPHISSLMRLGKLKMVESLSTTAELPRHFGRASLPLPGSPSSIVNFGASVTIRVACKCR